MSEQLAKSTAAQLQKRTTHFFYVITVGISLPVSSAILLACMTSCPNFFKTSLALDCKESKASQRGGEYRLGSVRFGSVRFGSVRSRADGQHQHRPSPIAHRSPLTRSRAHTLTRSHAHTLTRSRAHTLTRSHAHTLTRSRAHTLTLSPPPHHSPQGHPQRLPGHTAQDIS